MLYEGPIIYLLIGMTLFACALIAPREAWEKGQEDFPIPVSMFAFACIVFWYCVLLWPVVVASCFAQFRRLVVAAGKTIVLVTYNKYLRWRLRRKYRRITGRDLWDDIEKDQRR